MPNLIQDTITELERGGRFSLERAFRQHGSTTVFAHSVAVTRASLRLAALLHLRVRRRSLVRGALLHDYFLYDWHDPNHGRRPHGFTHPASALRNARADYRLDAVEENIIARHMFPLTLIPPACREAWLVCIADKYCAIRETLRRRPR